MKGQCRCGQLSYEVSAEPAYALYCHCHACQSRTSAPCVGFVMVKQQDLKVIGESQAYKDQGGSGAPIIQHRCSDCGCVVHSDLMVLDGIVAIGAATLDDPSDFKPQSHCWVSSQHPEFTINNDLPQEQGPPKALFQYIRKN